MCISKNKTSVCEPGISCGQPVIIPFILYNAKLKKDDASAIALLIYEDAFELNVLGFTGSNIEIRKSLT